METKKDKKIKNTKNPKKININISKREKYMQLMDFYNENIKKRHIIISVITVILFIIAFVTMIYSYKSGSTTISEETTSAAFKSQVKECFFLNAVLVFAGITPYCYLSILGIADAVIIVSDMVIRYALGSSFLVTLFLGGIIQVLGVSLVVAVGLYYCKLVTKKNKYYHQSDFSFDDIKKEVYEIRKNEAKVKEIKKKKEEKAKKIQECNIKIPYLKIISLGLFAFVIQFIGILITKI